MPVSESDDFDRELEGYDSVDTDFGTKIEWKQSVKFEGVFEGFRQVHDKESGDDIEAARFTDEGERYWSWMPFQLENALRNIEVGSTVVIVCIGEDENAPPPKRGRNKQLGFRVGVKG